MSDKVIKPSFFKSFQNNFVYGLFVILPIAATIFIVFNLVKLISYPLKDVIGLAISPLLSFILSILIITLVGMIAGNFIGKIFLRSKRRDPPRAGITTKTVLSLIIVGIVRKLGRNAKQRDVGV